MATILVVEDNKSAQLLTAARLRQKYTVLCADDGEQALQLYYETPVDCIVADVMMPRMDGFALLKALRAEGSTVPVLLLTARQAFEDKREGFSAGTDDYLTKPVNYDELIWHIEALLRRANIASAQRIEHSGLVVDANGYTVTWQGQPISLPKKEFDLLYKLLSYPGRIFTKNQLLDEIWGYNSESGEDTVKTHINRLRGRLKHCGAVQIATVKGIGYKAEVEQGEEP